MKKLLSYTFLSIILFVLSFKLFGFWYLSFISLVPLFYALNLKEHISIKKVFLIGVFFGGVYSTIMVSSVLYKHILMIAVVAPIYALVFGIFAITYRKLKNNTVRDIFLFTALWVICEWIKQFIFQDYDYTTIGYTAYAIPQLLSFASIGGRYLVSLIIVLINSFIGYYLINGYKGNLKKVFVICLIFFLSLYFGNKVYLNSGSHNGHEVSFSSIQLNETFDSYSKNINGVFALNPEIKLLIEKSIKQNINYIIYPSGLVRYVTISKNNPFKASYISGTFEEEDSVLKNLISKDTTFVFWNDSIKSESGSDVSDENNFWRNGSVIDYYQKRNIHPFYDIAAPYFRRFDIIKKPYDYVPSKENKIITIDGNRFSNLNCSEINYSYLARSDRELGANIIMSVGYSSVFEHPVLGQANIVLAQFRAVETNLPLVRSDILGPSAFIDKNGIILSESNSTEDDILIGKLFVEDSPVKTIYTCVGDYLLVAVLLCFLLFCMI